MKWRYMFMAMVLLAMIPVGVQAIEQEEIWERCYYVVQPGDTLDKIAADYQVSAAVIGQLNLIRGDQVIPGQILTLPALQKSRMEFGCLFLSPNDSVRFYTAAHFGVSDFSLLLLNHFPQEEKVLKGQILKIPVRASVFPLWDWEGLLADGYVVQNDDTISTISINFSVDPAFLAKKNELNVDSDLYPGQILRLGRIDWDENDPLRGYVVQKGDTLSRIAGRFGCSVDGIVAINDLKNRNQLVQGQILLLP